ncbi:MAG: peptidoglycan editing factor PgeF, partial [bacterium]
MSALLLLSAHTLRGAGIPHAFTTRRGGVSRGAFASLNLGRGVADEPGAVARNRDAVVRALGFHPRRQVEASQVHGPVVAVVTAADVGSKVEGADGMVTADADLVLAVHAADCVPILLADPRTRTVAAVHAGWKGTAAGVSVEAVRVMVDRFGARPESLLAAIGPSIGPCHYEVDEPVIERFSGWSWWREVAVPNPRGRWQLDLRAANRRQLADVGVPPEHIEILD